MLPSSNNNPFSYTSIEDLPGQSSTNYDHDPNCEASFFPFPSPFFDDNDLLLDHLVHQQMFMVDDISGLAENDVYSLEALNKASGHMNTNTAIEQIPSQVDPKTTSESAKSPNPQKRRDRHSKINTAHGPRDRRMRLSLPISREFFGLQDRLGFDKASKTIEWLFTESKEAIIDLATRKQSQLNNNDLIAAVLGEALEGFHTEEKKSKRARQALPSPLAKESRDKARARARERTREKMVMRSLDKKEKYCFEPNPNLDSFGAAISQVGEEDSSYGLHGHEMGFQSLEHQLANVEIMEKLWANPSYNFQNNACVSDGVLFNNNNSMNFLGNWEFNNGGISSDYGAVLTNKVPLQAGNDLDQNPSSLFITNSNSYFQESQF